MRKRKLEDGKNQFSELVRSAEKGGPQLVTKSGRDAVVVLSVEDYARLAGPESLVEFLAGSPFAEALREGALDLERTPDFGRHVAI